MFLSCEHIKYKVSQYIRPSHRWREPVATQQGERGGGRGGGGDGGTHWGENQTNHQGFHGSVKQ